MALFGKQRLGIDLGTANTIIYIENKGIALREPSIIAINSETKEVVAYGKEAAALVGRTSDKYETIHPIQDGVIADFSLTKQLLAFFIKKALHRSLSKPEVVISVPSNISKVERRAVVDALKDLGIGRAMIIDESFSAAVGANLPIYEPRGHLLVDIGAGTTNIALISYGEVVKSLTSRAAGNAMNQAIKELVRTHYHLVIGDQAAEDLKLSIGNAAYADYDKEDTLVVKGRNSGTGLPDSKEVTAAVVAQGLDEVIHQIATGIRQVLEVTPPELAADISENGIVLTGGAALLKRLPERLHDSVGVPVHLSQQPIDAVAIGAGKMLKTMTDQAKEKERNAR